MLSSESQFQIYVSAAGADDARRGALMKALERYAIETENEIAFLEGERILLCAESSEAAAQRTAKALRALGLFVDVEGKEPELDMVDLESFTNTEGPKLATIPVEDNGLFDVGAGLVGLDFGATGGEEEAPRPVSAPREIALADLAPPPPRPASPPPAPPPVASAQREIALADLEPAPLPAAPVPRPAPRAAPPAAPKASPDGDALELDAPSRPAAVMKSELALDRPAPAPMSSPAPPPNEPVEVPRCPTHGLALMNDRCTRCDADEAKLRSRLFGGKLHGNLAMRVGIGLVGGLLLGWVVTAPITRRAERAVDYIREEAKRERARPLEEAQEHAAALDAKAEDASSAAFNRSLIIWGLITAAVTAVWFRLT